jgi:hypothetical protein
MTVQIQPSPCQIRKQKFEFVPSEMENQAQDAGLAAQQQNVQNLLQVSGHKMIFMRHSIANLNLKPNSSEDSTGTALLK